MSPYNEKSCDGSGFKQKLELTKMPRLPSICVRSDLIYDETLCP